jgi:hypothetical protein
VGAIVSYRMRRQLDETWTTFFYFVGVDADLFTFFLGEMFLTFHSSKKQTNNHGNILIMSLSLMIIFRWFRWSYILDVLYMNMSLKQVK